MQRLWLRSIDGFQNLCNFFTQLVNWFRFLNMSSLFYIKIFAIFYKIKWRTKSARTYELTRRYHFTNCIKKLQILWLHRFDGFQNICNFFCRLWTGTGFSICPRFFHSLPFFINVHGQTYSPKFDYFNTSIKLINTNFESTNGRVNL